MPYAIRVRIYRAGVLAADTDPETPENEPGAEIVPTLDAVQAAMVELCQAAHPGARLLGFGDEAMRAYGAMMRERAGAGRSFNYRQGYTALIDTPEVRSATAWLAQVDIAVSR